MEENSDEETNALHPAHAPPTPTPVKKSGRKQKNDVGSGEEKHFRIPSSRRGQKQVNEEEIAPTRNNRRNVVQSDSDEDFDDDSSANSGNAILSIILTII